jgi:GR25 family glycosyltransferase involved in LPS biosynthesis
MNSSNIWKYIIYNCSYALILEDDACFDKDWKNKLDQFFIDIKDDQWDAIFLNASEPMEDLNKWKIANEQYLTGGYILSKKGAMTLLKLFEGQYASSDWMTSRLQLFNHSYSYFPWLIIQEGKDSTIGSNVIEDYKKVLRCLNNNLDNYI